VLVSIVIPAYNAERFIAETLQSALAQKVEDKEIIAIDDGSTDGTPAVLRGFGDAIRCETGPNRGASAARNRGTALARGRYLQYLDADDVLEPDAVAKRIAALESAGADVAYSDWQRIQEQPDGSFAPGEVVARDMAQVHADPELATFTSFWAPPAALLYSRGIVERIGGWNESLPVIQDARFLQDAALCGARFVHVAGVGARYRMHRDQRLSTRDDVALARDILRNACDIQAIWEKRGMLTAERRAALAGTFDFSCRALYAADPGEFSRSLERLYAMRPGFQPSWPKIAGIARTVLGHAGAGALMRLFGRPPPAKR
jgi:glycosyltransferase involved in cell wall biosynthesis